MSNNQIKPITISPGLLNIGPRSVKNKTVKRGQNNTAKPNLLKRDLLAKIKNYRTNKLRHNDVADQPPASSTIPSKPISDTISNPVIRKPEHQNPPVSVVRESNTRRPNNEGDDDFSQSINFLKTLSAKKKRHNEKNQDDFPVVLEDPESKSSIQGSPPYSCLKNSSLPTFREWRNKTMKKTDDHTHQSNNEIISENMKPPLNLDKSSRNNRAVTFKYNLGKRGD